MTSSARTWSLTPGTIWRDRIVVGAEADLVRASLFHVVNQIEMDIKIEENKEEGGSKRSRAMHWIPRVSAMRIWSVSMSMAT